MRVRSFLSATVGAAVVLVAARAFAEDDAARARVLFQQGRALVAAGNYEAACSRFEESRNLVPGVGNAFNLADCWEHVGRLDSAHELFVKVANVTHKLAQFDREKVARDRATSLESRILQETGAPVDISEAPTPALRVRPSTRVTSVRTASASRPSEDADRYERPRVGETSKTVSHVLLGAAAVGAVAAGVSLAIYAHKNSEAEDICPRGVGCSQAEIDRHGELIDGARTARVVGCVGLSVTGMSLLSAAAITLTRSYLQSTPARDSSGWSGGLSASPDSASIFVRRGF